MITPAYCQTMARYNAWQNQAIYVAADGLDDAAREADRGAFFGSIRATLSHLMWGDLVWLARFDDGPGPPAVSSSAETAQAFDWPALMAQRPKLDARIAAWAWMLLPEDLDGDLTWTVRGTGEVKTKTKALCVMQFFNHQTHHRGQVHAMLTAAGVKTTDTDLPYMPDEVPEWR